MYTTRYLGKDRDYVVLRHPLRDTEGMIAGVLFRRGYCVIEKNSRDYIKLKKLPHLKNCLEFPLIHLKKLPFILRDREVNMVFGKDVYIHYMKALQEYNEDYEVASKRTEHLSSEHLCKYVRENGELCRNLISELSPSKHCSKHLMEDPIVIEMGLSTTKNLARDEKKVWKEKLKKRLKKLKEDNVF